MLCCVHVTVTWSLSLLVFDNHTLPLCLSSKFPAESKHCEKRDPNNPAPEHFIQFLFLCVFFRLFVCLGNG